MTDRRDDQFQARVELHEARRQKRKLQENVRRLQMKLENKQHMAALLLEEQEDPPDKDMLVCSKCGLVGHMCTNSICPLNPK